MSISALLTKPVYLSVKLLWVDSDVVLFKDDMNRIEIHSLRDIVNSKAECCDLPAIDVCQTINYYDFWFQHLLILSMALFFIPKWRISPGLNCKGNGGLRISSPHGVFILGFSPCEMAPYHFAWKGLDCPKSKAEGEWPLLAQLTFSIQSLISDKCLH